MSRRRPPRLIVTFVAAVSLAAGCSEQRPTGGELVQSPPVSSTEDIESHEWEQLGGPIVIGRQSTLVDSTVALAQQNGWFEQFGLEIDVFEGRTTNDLLPAFLAGEIDVMVGGLQAGLITAIAEGAQIRAVSVVMTLDPSECSYYGLMMLPDAAADFDPTDAAYLAGLRIGGPFRGGFTGLWAMDALAASVGLSLEDLDLRPVSVPESAATLVGDGVDAVLTGDPTLTSIREQFGGVEVLPVSELLPERVVLLLYMGPRLLEDRELAARYLAVHTLAHRRHAEGATDRNIAALSDPTGLEPELLADMCWAVPEPASRPYEDAVLEAMRFAERVGEIDAAVAPDQYWAHDVHDLASGLLADMP